MPGTREGGIKEYRRITLLRRYPLNSTNYTTSAHKAQRHLGATWTTNNSIDAVEQKNANLNLREALNICLFSLTRGATPRTYRFFGEEARARLHILY